jgi:hypothetical protein
LSKLSGGFEPFVIADPKSKTYRINDLKKLIKHLRPELNEFEVFLNKVKELLK